LIWGILGQTIGLIGAFDSIQATGDVSPGIYGRRIKNFVTDNFIRVCYFFSRSFRNYYFGLAEKGKITQIKKLIF